jgi:hypothetical protein
VIIAQKTGLKSVTEELVLIWMRTRRIAKLPLPQNAGPAPQKPSNEMIAPRFIYFLGG